GAWRDGAGRPIDESRPTSTHIGAREITRGSRVRVRPKKVADVFDLVLSGKTAIVRSLEQDLEGQEHLCVAFEDDPGRELEQKAQLGHRFFFRPEDVEPL